MPCYCPLVGWRAKSIGPSGRRAIVFNRREAWRETIDDPVTLPCGQCIGCRLERSRQWAIRCVHESKMHEHNCFITLTYDDAHLPENMSVNKREFQLFMKRLRKQYGNGIRFFACGEYGDKSGRPHYHACLFNHDFRDKVLWRRSKDTPLFRSSSLEVLWPYGFASVGAVTFQSSAYVARYILKKVTGDRSQQHYEHICSKTGLISQRSKEFVLMSRRPGIGRTWYQAHRGDVYPRDEVVVNGVAMRPPRYYDGVYELSEPEVLTDLKTARKDRAREHAVDNEVDRRRVREKVQIEKAERLKRAVD